MIPSLLGTGIAAMILAAATLAWATAFVHRPHGGLVLLLAVALFLASGGFTTFRFGLLAGIAGTQAGAPLTGRTRVGPRLSGLLARLWPWLLVASLAWAAASWVIAARQPDAQAHTRRDGCHALHTRLDPAVRPRA